MISLYKRTIINTNQGLETLISEVARSEGWLAFDTETTGLHLKKDTPFLITLTFKNNSLQ